MMLSSMGHQLDGVLAMTLKGLVPINRSGGSGRSLWNNDAISSSDMVEAIEDPSVGSLGCSLRRRFRSSKHIPEP